MRTQAPLLAPIFRSDGQARLLAALVLTGDELSISELAERAGLAYATAHREVKRLVDAGILTSRTVGRTHLIGANVDSPLTPPIREILAIAVGPVPALREALGPIDAIVSAFIYGSFAARMRGVPGPDPSAIDVMIVGDPRTEEVFDACRGVETEVRRPVSPTSLSAREFSGATGFLETVRSQPVVPIMGEELWH